MVSAWRLGLRCEGAFVFVCCGDAESGAGSEVQKVLVGGCRSPVGGFLDVDISAWYTRKLSACGFLH